MRTLLLCSSLLLVAAAPAAGKEASPPAGTCDAKHYGYLVGQDFTQAQVISANYRVLNVGEKRGQEKSNRITITVDPTSNQIVAIDCG